MRAQLAAVLLAALWAAAPMAVLAVEAPPPIRPADELCAKTCAPDGAAYVCDQAAGQTYENPCYASCYGVAATVPGPCPPPELKASRRAAKYLQAIQRDAPTEIPPLADPLTPEQQAAQNASVNAALLAAGAGGGGAGGAAAAGAGAGAGGPTTTLSFAGKITPAGPLVVPSAGQSVRRVDRAAVRKSLLDAKQAPANATSASVAGAVTPKALYSQLYVRRACGEAADLWFAASWIPYGYSTWVTQGWWRIPNDGGAVYFGNTANRYFYIYAYAQQCAWGRCCNTLRWSGSTSIRIGYYNYGFIKYDFGGYINPTYTVVLSCACRFMFCFTAPCCRCC